MPERTDQLTLNVNLQSFGQRPAAWQFGPTTPDTLISPQHWIESARAAERGLLDAVFFADQPALHNPDPRPGNPLEPITLAALITAATEHVGVIASASTTYNDPVELAERLLGTDVVSGGRLGWNIVTTYNQAVAGNFGLDAGPDRVTRYRRAADFVDAVTAVWDGAASGGDYRHSGEFYDIAGTTALGPSTQGHPVLFQAGGSSQGRDLAAQHADGVFTVELTLPRAIENYADLRRRAAASGRRDVPKITPGLSLVIGSTVSEARRRFDDFEVRVPDGYALRSLSNVLAHDATTLDVDSPIPPEVLDKPWDPDSHPASAGYRLTFLDWIQERRHQTIREILRDFGGYGSRIIVGTPEQIADDIELWFRSGAADGFNLMIDQFPHGLTVFADEVVPLLQAKGIHKREYDARTLRGAIGLPERIAVH
ncbi:FMN-dependent oxidoreductase (nitrilotriacetate monooxygenase family) [Microbacterium terrae]|uniref:Nitrilotriacetate monooxygenase component A n=1 Tax=Microbacterium terrae TaxID=69369 RepID=A0A0M2HKD1_9MICO|nr:NtaA/DmoA family FMN-dependent monooxygenase [Microbacterium terrae]KJL45322.1 Nitrilotriacetate monooxygenase component A [Microbacterium terrae]MBP1078430.1 FMN-dependent oxidoreductase (nitrilotriacetate monooxygenase family) [Microbacterium terrae]GLJ99330.1 nitrilotriacetate monooxygenase component A [Microbacterium terrae]